MLEDKVKRAVIKGSLDMTANKEQAICENEQSEMVEEGHQEEEQSNQGQSGGLEMVRATILKKIEKETREKVVQGKASLNEMDWVLKEEMGLMGAKDGNFRLKKYLEDQTDQIQNMTKKFGQNLMKEELDKQVQEKDKISRQKREEEEEYNQAADQLIQERKQTQIKEFHEMNENKKKNLKMQENVIQTKKNRQLREHQREEENDKRLAEANKLELENQILNKERSKKVTTS